MFYYLSRNVRKHTFGHVNPATIQISCAFAQSDQNLHSALFKVKDAKCFRMDSEDYDETARMRRLIRVFVWRTGLTLLLIIFLLLNDTILHNTAHTWAIEQILDNISLSSNMYYLQSNFDGSNPFGTTKICSRQR